MPVDSNWTEGRVAPVGKPQVDGVEYTVSSVAPKWAVNEHVTSGQMGSVRRLAEFTERPDAEDYANLLREQERRSKAIDADVVE